MLPQRRGDKTGSKKGLEQEEEQGIRCKSNNEYKHSTRFGEATSRTGVGVVAPRRYVRGSCTDKPCIGKRTPIEGRSIGEQSQ